jgi:hypothetical protein
MSFEYFDMNFRSLGSDLSVTPYGVMELAPFSAKIGIGCQGFTGPLPSAFLDK